MEYVAQHFKFQLENIKIELIKCNKHVIQRLMKPTQPHSDKHNSVKEYWIIFKERDCLIRSVKQVFQNYKEWCQENDKPLQNEFKFRTFIRKNGYNNGGELLTPKMRKERKLRLVVQS